jgi:2-hydroxychromene-2-carboxylate isomerase
MAEQRRIRFYFDYISPNAYIAWTQIGGLAERHGCEVEPVPVLYAAMLNAHGQLGPAEIRPKAAWMWRNVMRKAALLGIPLHPPRSHPFNPLLALRVTSLSMNPSVRSAVIDTLFAAVWSGGPGVVDREVVARITTEAGLDGEAAVDHAAEPQAKKWLFDQTEQSIADGVFGVPSMKVGDELFWGYDDFPYLERYLRGEDPLDRGQLSAWSKVRPSAQRQRRGRP